MNRLKSLVKSLSRKERLPVLTVLKERAMRNIEISKKLGIRKERVSESLGDLVENRLAVRFEKGALKREKQAFYVGTPLAEEVYGLDGRIEKMEQILPTEITNFGDGVGYLLKFYLECDVDVDYSTAKSRSGRKVNLKVSREKCEKGEGCEIVCEPIIRAVTGKFGNVEALERTKCSFDISILFNA